LYFLKNIENHGIKTLIIISFNRRYWFSCPSSKAYALYHSVVCNCNYVSYSIT